MSLIHLTLVFLAGLRVQTLQWTPTCLDEATILLILVTGGEYARISLFAVSYNFHIEPEPI